MADARRLPIQIPRMRTAIADFPYGRVREVRARHDIIRQGDAPRAVSLIVEGWAFRYKQLSDGRRQLLSIFLPGEICDATIYLLSVLDHSVAALTTVRVADVSPAEFETAFTDADQLARTLWLHDLRMLAIQREWTTNIGQRTGPERVAHLLCETFHRLRHIGLTDGDRCAFPLTQTDLADATGMTTVHVNRVLQQLRGLGLIELGRRTLHIPNLAALEEMALFDPTYLHLD